MFEVTCMSNPGTLFKLKKIKLWNVVIICLKTKHYFSFRWKNKKFFVDGWKSALVNQTRVTINDVDCPCKSSINQCVYPSGLRSVEFQMVNWVVSTLWLIQRLAHDKLFYLRQKLNTKEGSGGGCYRFTMTEMASMRVIQGKSLKNSLFFYSYFF